MNQILLIVLAAIVAFISILFIFFFIIKRKHKLIKAAQPIMIGAILFGQLLSAVKIFIVSFPITDMSCISGLWFAHLSFVLVFGSLFVKTYRVHCIVNAG